MLNIISPCNVFVFLRENMFFSKCFSCSCVVLDFLSFVFFLIVSLHGERESGSRIQFCTSFRNCQITPECLALSPPSSPSPSRMFATFMRAIPSRHINCLRVSENILRTGWRKAILSLAFPPSSASPKSSSTFVGRFQIETYTKASSKCRAKGFLTHRAVDQLLE